MFRNYRSCCYMNNNIDDNNQVIENKCSNVVSYENDSDSCSCGFDDDGMNVFPENPMFGQSYVPIQYMNKTYKPQVGLEMGTIFPELVSQYEPCQSMAEHKYIQKTNEIGEGCNG